MLAFLLSACLLLTERPEDKCPEACPGNYGCRDNGLCRHICWDDRGCADGYYCDTLYAKCFKACQEEDCPGGYACAYDDICVDYCVDDDECKSDYRCDDDGDCVRR